MISVELLPHKEYQFTLIDISDFSYKGINKEKNNKNQVQEKGKK